MISESRWAIVVGLLLCAPGLSGVVRADSRDDEIEKLKKAVESMQKTIEQQNQKIQEIEKAQGKTTLEAIMAQISPEAVEPPAATSPVTERDSFNDQQEAAPRPGDLTLDPKYRGFTADPEHDGADQVQRQAAHRHDVRQPERRRRQPLRHRQDPRRRRPGQGWQPVFNINAKGSQLRIDVRAPEVAGAPRFYYENDFYGSGGGEFPYRVRHLYGEIYNIIVGQTFSIFEDPDIWPDTVDYEGPNSAIFARRPLVRYQHRLGKRVAAELRHRAARIGGRYVRPIRRERPQQRARRRLQRALGARRASATCSSRRSCATSASTGLRHGKQSVFGWGLNLAGGLDTLRARLAAGAADVRRRACSATATTTSRTTTRRSTATATSRRFRTSAP